MLQLDEKAQRESSCNFRRYAWAMYHLLAIHPFVDGNGQVARLLGNYALKHSA